MVVVHWKFMEIHLEMHRTYAGFNIFNGTAPLKKVDRQMLFRSLVQFGRWDFSQGAVFLGEIRAISSDINGRG